MAPSRRMKAQSRSPLRVGRRGREDDPLASFAWRKMDLSTAAIRDRCGPPAPESWRSGLYKNSDRGGQERSNAALFLPGWFGGVSEVPNANPCVPSRTPTDFSADMALGGSGHADTINSYPTRAACFADLRDHGVRLMKRRERHGLSRGCDGQGKGDSDQSDHCFLPCDFFKEGFLEGCCDPALLQLSNRSTQVKGLRDER